MNKRSEWDKLLNPNIFKRTELKLDELIFKFNIWRDIKLGYINPHGRPIKCSKCKCKDIEDYGEYYEGSWLIEYSTRCKDCGQKLGHWAYGNWSM